MPAPSATLAAALALGLAGSLHCVGMCGPLALALPRAAGGKAAFLAGRLLYNLGRAVTYAGMGAVFGLLGKTLLLAGWQRGLSIAAGALMVAYAIATLWGGSRWTLESAGLRFVAPIQRALGRLLAQGSPRGLFTIGLLNGLLPCGLVYVALAGAAASGSPGPGAAFMFVFGLGTLPLMLAVALLGPSLQHRLRGRIQTVIPILLAVLGILVILRGLELGIPYVSPNLSAQVNRDAKPACCAHGHEPE